MQIGGELAAFRASRAAQDAAQAAMIRSAQCWRAGADVAAVLSDLERYGAGEGLDQTSALSGLFADRGAAEDFARTFLAQAAAALAQAPLGQPCFRHSCEGGYTLIHLANAGRASLSLVVVEGDGGSQRATPASATLTAAERSEIVLAGDAHGEIVGLNGDRLDRAARRFAAGDILDMPAWSTRIFHRVHASLACLRLARMPERVPPTRQVQLGDGVLLHEAAGDPRDTRHELMGALLTAMERSDAAPVLARLACTQGHDPTRWQAVKGALALDTATGFAALSALAADRSDPLSRNASALRAALVARHPVLAEWEPV